MAVGRELTKVHEELWRGTLGEAVELGREPASPGGSGCWSSAAPSPADRGPPSDAEVIEAAPATRLAAAPTGVRPWPAWPPSCDCPNARCTSWRWGWRRRRPGPAGRPT